jgi:hypothetical protein
LVFLVVRKITMWERKTVMVFGARSYNLTKNSMLDNIERFIADSEIWVGGKAKELIVEVFKNKSLFMAFCLSISRQIFASIRQKSDAQKGRDKLKSADYAD